MSGAEDTLLVGLGFFVKQKTQTVKKALNNKAVQQEGLKVSYCS